MFYFKFLTTCGVCGVFEPGAALGTAMSYMCLLLSLASKYGIVVAKGYDERVRRRAGTMALGRVEAANHFTQLHQVTLDEIANAKRLAEPAPKRIKKEVEPKGGKLKGKGLGRGGKGKDTEKGKGKRRGKRGGHPQEGADLAGGEAQGDHAQGEGTN